MSSRSKFVQINRSLIVLDPQTMPVNLAQTVREDAPEQSFPALAYDGKNVLPTALGYASYFGEHTRLNIGDGLKNLKVQHVFQFQSSNLRTLSIALCETGIYIAGATEGAGSFNWQLVVDFNSSYIEGVRRLWTFCVISNRLYMYQQGQDAFYALVNAAEYLETTIPSGIDNASIQQVWFHELSQTGMLKYKPNFINMEGQIGIFKAGNRLGFWDSDSSVAWSSATQVYDFVPSTTTFAGITKFADVVGRITAIHQHGTGFIIYATRSIVVVSALSGSPEKWAGRAIFSDVGVVFDCQVAMAQPDSIHYAITSAGLCRISNGTPEIIETEVMDYVRNNNDIYAVSFIDSRYLFIHVTNTFDSALPEIDAVRLQDSEGNQFYFPRPDEVLPETGLGYLESFLNGSLPSQQEEFEDAQEPVEGAVFPKNGEALLPCWTVRTLVTDYKADELTRRYDWSVQAVPAAIGDWEYPPNTNTTGYYELRNLPNFTSHYYDLNRTAIDQGPDEFLEILTERFQEIADINNSAESNGGRFLSISTGQTGGYKCRVVSPTTPLGLSAPKTVNKEYVTERYNDLIQSYEAKVTDCGIELEAQLVDIIGTMAVTEVRDTTRRLYDMMRVYVLRSTTTTGDGAVENIEPIVGISFRFAGSSIAIDEQSAIMHSIAIKKEMRPPLNWQAKQGTFMDYSTWTNIQDLEEYTYTSNDPERSRHKRWYPQKNPSTQKMEWVETSDFAADSVEMALALDVPPPPPILVISEYVNPNPPAGAEECLEDFTSGDPSDLDFIYNTPILGAAPGSWISQEWSWSSGVKSCAWQYANVTFSRTTERLFPGMISLDQRDFSVGIRSFENIIAEVSGAYSEAIRDRVVAKVTDALNNYLPTISHPYSRTMEVQKEFDFSVHPEKTVVFQAEVSGYGYYPYGGFSFRKTHSRSIFKPCGYNKSPVIFNDIPPKDIGGISIEKFIPGAEDGNGGVPNPPYVWDYPETIPLAPNYALFQTGTFAPYYPTYEEAVILDTQLMKWGRYNHLHKYVYSLIPFNRTDQTIVPAEAGTMRAGALSTEGWCTIFTKENPDSTITYGKIGDYRLGWTRATKAIAQFGYTSDCYMIVETSINGDSVDESLSNAIEVIQSRRAEIPFTLAGKWFNIRFQGTFNLVGLSLESEATSRR